MMRIFPDFTKQLPQALGGRTRRTHVRRWIFKGLFIVFFLIVFTRDEKIIDVTECF